MRSSLKSANTRLSNFFLVLQKEIFLFYLNNIFRNLCSWTNIQDYSHQILLYHCIADKPNLKFKYQFVVLFTSHKWNIFLLSLTSFFSYPPVIHCIQLPGPTTSNSVHIPLAGLLCLRQLYKQGYAILVAYQSGILKLI